MFDYFEIDRHKFSELFEFISHFCWNMLHSHSTQAYVALIIHSRVLYKGGVCIIFQVVLSHHKERGST